MEKAKIKCPHCTETFEIDIPKDQSLQFYQCPVCQEMIETPAGECCIVCSYSDKQCENPL